MTRLFNNTNIYANGPSSQFGCVGGFFTLPDDSEVYGITNFHVVEKDGQASLDAPIFKRGTKSQIGQLKYWYELETGEGLNYFDMALFKVDQTNVSPSWNMGISGFADAGSADQVQLVKGNNLMQTGTCTGLLQGPFSIELETQHYKFTNLLQIQSSSENAPFSSSGDSGSVIVSGDKIVALLVGADSNNPLISYGIPFVDNTSNKGILNFFSLKPLTQ
jgi:hypothetical protein